METFVKLFERFLVCVYHCFDRIVIRGYLPLLSRSEHIVYSFRDVHGIYPIAPQALAKRTPEYRAWVEGYARNHKIPMKSPAKDESKEEFRPAASAAYGKSGPARGVLRHPEHGDGQDVLFAPAGISYRRPGLSSCRVGRAARIITFTFAIQYSARCPWVSVRTCHFGPPTASMATISSRSNCAAREWHFAKTTTHSSPLRTPRRSKATADKLSAAIIEKRFNYWSWLLCPKFSEKDRKAVNPRRDYSIKQIEYCRNFIFKRHFPIHKIFEHWKNSTTATMSCASTERTWWAACTKSSAPSRGWKCASAG